MDARASSFGGVKVKFTTKTIHIGTDPDRETGAIMPPIYMTSTFLQTAPGEGSGYEYTRMA